MPDSIVDNPTFRIVLYVVAYIIFGIGSYLAVIAYTASGLYNTDEWIKSKTNLPVCIALTIFGSLSLLGCLLAYRYIDYDTFIYLLLLLCVLSFGISISSIQLTILSKM